MQTTISRTRPRGYARHPGDVLRLVLGALILLATMTAIHQHRIGVREACRACPPPPRR
jgi:hypothetical protein